MDAAVIVAVIALVGTLANVGLTYTLNARSENRREYQKSDAIWNRYRTSFAFAAEELADRIDNVLNRSFLDAYARSGQKDEAILSTLFRFAQYFGWSEILRQSMRSPDPRHAAEAARLKEAQAQVGRTFATDRYGPGAFMVWCEAQRAIGELMITRDGETIDTIGVAGFLDEFERFRPWLHRMQRLLETQQPIAWGQGERERLADLQVALKAIS